MRNVMPDRTRPEDIIQQLRVQYAQVVMLFMIIMALLVSAILIVTRSPSVSGITLMLAITVLMTGLFLLLRNNRLTGMIIHLVALVLALASFAVTEANPQALTTGIITLAMIFSAIMTGRFAFQIIVAILIVRLLLLILNTLSFYAGSPPADVLITVVLVGVFPLMTAGVVRYFVNTLQETATRAGRIAQLLEATSSTGQAMSRLLDMNELLRRAVDLIRDRFGFYHVQIFMLDDKGAYALLSASTGEIGQKLLARGHRIAVNSQTIIGRVLQAGEAVIARNTDIAGLSIDQEVLSRTRSELALPIMDGETVIGAVDVHSMRPSAFTSVEIQALQVMTGQLATAIRNARLFLAQEQSLRENKRLFLEAETSLREIQRLNRQLTRQTWEDYLTANRAISGVTLDGSRFFPGAEWSERMLEAGTRRRVITQNTPDTHVIAVPVELRGEVIGAIEIEVAGGIHTEDAVDMMQAIAGRLAISLDNARLFEETQAATAQEQRISEIVSQYQSAATVDDLLQITLQGLFETLGAEKASIRLGTLSNDDQNGASS